MIKPIKFASVVMCMLIGFNSTAQTENSKSEIEQITETLMLYIDGTANGEPDKLRDAFHPDFNL